MKYIKLFKDYAKWNLVLEKSNAEESPFKSDDLE